MTDNKEKEDILNSTNKEESSKSKANPSVNYWLAFFFGAVIASVIITSILPRLANQVVNVVEIVGYTTIFLATLFLFFTIFKEGLFKFLFGFSQTDLKDVQKSGESLFDNYQNKDWKAAKDDLKTIGKKGLAWYSWKNYRLWVVQLFQVLFIGFAGLFGSMLLYNQNQLLEKQTNLLEKQNEKIDNQIQLEESSRRGNLIGMMSNIMDKVDEELKSDWNDDDKRNLSPELLGRITSLLQSFQPYRFLQDSMLTERPLSPERGQVLLSFANSNLAVDTYRFLLKKCSFENAYLPGANLRELELQEANLSGVDFRGAYLERANFRLGLLANADFGGARLSRTDFSAAYLGGANLRGCSLWEVDLTQTIIDKADMREVNLTDAKVYETDWIDNLKKWQVIGYEEIAKKWMVDTNRISDDRHGLYYKIKPKS